MSNHSLKVQDNIARDAETERGAEEEQRDKTVDTDEKQNYLPREINEKEEEKVGTEFIGEEELEEIFKHQERRKQLIKGLIK